jgi:multicomponent Na+:H+ antiporter subunit E
MNLLVLNLFLALGWALVTGSFTVWTFVVGFALGYLALWIVRPLYGPTRYFERFWLLLRLIGYFLYELVLSSLNVAWDTITPWHLSCPGIVAIPLDVRTDAEILMLANLVSLTPGTLSLEISEDRRTLYVHFMFVRDPDAERARIKGGIERRLLEMTR